MMLTEDVTLGGISQRIWIRGASKENPFLILLHGGPGLSETALFRHFNRELENQFTIVYWDQRGTGRSYSSDILPAQMTFEKFIRDLHELISLLKQRYGISKVVLLGHSWGSAMGIKYAQLHPENVAAYVGVGQIANMQKGEELSYQFALNQARDLKHAKAERALEKIGPPPHSVEQLLISRRWSEKFGGAFGGGMTQTTLALAALQSGEMGLKDFWLFYKGLAFSLKTLWPEIRLLDLTVYTKFRVPVFFILGRKDQQVPAVLAEDYFTAIQAPFKNLFWLENSGHYGHFEENEKFKKILVHEVLPKLRTHL